MIRQDILPDAWARQQLEHTARFFQERDKSAYLVGGSLRNLFWGESCHDWDIVTRHDAAKLARHLADTLNGFYAPMNAKASRVVLKTAQHEMTIDVAQLQGQSIEEDLQARDFTINTLAIPLSEITPLLEHGMIPDEATLIARGSSLQDLHTHTLRAVADNSLQKDPLRMLRAVRFMTYYDLSIDKQTAQMLTRDAHLLSHVASERIHEELMLILRPQGAHQRLRFLDEHGLLTTLMPELEQGRGMAQPSLHHWDVFDHSLEAVTTLELLDTTLRRPAEELKDSPLDTSGEGSILKLQQLLVEAQHQELFQMDDLRSVPMKLGALLHDIGKPTTHLVDEEGNITFYHHPQAGVPIAQQITRRLGLSTREQRVVQQLVAHHMRPGQLSHDTVSARAIRRYFVDLGPRGIHVALVSLADHLAMRGPEPLTAHWHRHLATVCLLLTRYIRERDSVLPPRLIQADELMHRLHIEPGPLVGKLLESIAEAQADGIIHSKEEALWLAEEKLQRPHREM